MYLEASRIGFGRNGMLSSCIEYWEDEIRSDQTEGILKEIEEKKLAAKKEKTKGLYVLIKKRFDAQELEMPYAIKCWIQDP